MRCSADRTRWRESLFQETVAGGNWVCQPRTSRFPPCSRFRVSGVYAVMVGIDGSDHPGVANLGVRPTFDGTEQVLEVHVLDYDRNLYGKQIRVGFVGAHP